MKEHDSRNDRQEIDKKLEKDLESIRKLKETLQKSNNLTQGMTGILTSFENRLAKLEETILPVYNETENLQRRQENIERTVGALDHVISYYNVLRGCENVIKEGPLGKVDKYLESLAKLQHASDYFDKHNPHSPELSSLVSLYEIGADNLEKEFQLILHRYCKPLPPVAILDMLGMDDELPNDDDRSMEQQLPDKVAEELSSISDWLITNSKEDFMVSYVTIRSDIMVRSIQGLKDFQKSSSGSSNFNINLFNSPNLSRNRSKETPSRKTAKKIQQALMKRAAHSAMKYSQSSDQSLSSGLGHHHRQGSFFEPRDDTLDQEVEHYIICFSALHKLMQCELQLMQGIIPRNHQQAVFERIVQAGLDLILEEGEKIASKAKKSAGKHEFSAALSVFPILKQVVSLRSEFEMLLEDRSAGRPKLQSLITTLQTVGLKTLDEYIDSIKNDPDRQMPKDGTVHEQTSNGMIFLEQLLDYVTTVGTVLSKDQSYHASLMNCNDENRCKVAFGVYIIRVLSTLGLSLNNKSEMYGDPYLKAIFRLNNFHYIQKSLQRSGLMDVARLYSPDLDVHYDDQILEQKRLYSQSWSRALHYVMEVDRPLMGQAANVKLKDKDRQSIKDKFNGFNKEIEDIYRIQKGYAIPDVELRESLKRDNKEFILPRYKNFYDKYINTPFTKNREKYFKYNPVMVSSLIDRFFDVAA